SRSSTVTAAVVLVGDFKAAGQAGQAGGERQAALEAALTDVLLQHHALMGEPAGQQALPPRAVPASHDGRQLLQGPVGRREAEGGSGAPVLPSSASRLPSM